MIIGQLPKKYGTLTISVEPANDGYQAVRTYPLVNHPTLSETILRSTASKVYKRKSSAIKAANVELDWQRANG